MNLTILAFGMAGGWEWIALLILGVIIFGNRLPSVARGLGRSVVEFKKGLREINTDIDDASKDNPEKIETPAESTTTE